MKAIVRLSLRVEKVRRLKSVKMVRLASGIADSLPLSGVRVLDMSRVLAAPYCTQLLGDMGAEIIKIEHPKTGDETRSWGPPFTEKGKESAYFLSCNRNKKSLALDIKSEAGKKVIYDLSKQCDIWVDNFMPGSLDKLNLGYEDISNDNINPDIIYCSITAFGNEGPYVHYGGYDVIVQAIGGLMDITGEADGSPCKTGVALIDVITGLYAHGAILAALRSRDNARAAQVQVRAQQEQNNNNNNKQLRQRNGMKIDINLLDCEIASLVNIASNYLIGKTVSKRYGTAHASIVPYQIFPTKNQNQYLCVAATNDASFATLCEIMDLQDTLLTQHKFQTNQLRVQHREELLRILTQCFQQRTLAEWLDRFSHFNIPHGPIQNVQQILDSEHVQSRDFQLVQSVEHSSAGKVSLLTNPVQYTPKGHTQRLPINQIRLPPPVLGEHSLEVLERVLGYDTRHIQKLIQDGVVVQPNILIFFFFCNNSSNHFRNLCLFKKFKSLCHSKKKKRGAWTPSFVEYIFFPDFEIKYKLKTKKKKSTTSKKEICLSRKIHKKYEPQNTGEIKKQKA
ncbi:hypothetical protein RFI_06706 [Reticulomyxa filosa]|uniref:Uncharacterized protein n=1 Tax=Reticulomyxa filosa TaxID=46433 RepID=X6NX70_RETFI|nr:hypothetical protein RFI_06706 [Reticulomyxa filosa]|eukprot:ETO30414.1 hypothetical protein RFI_06706 [Reticulomyxa filosa]